jgi:hypothetical protein
MVGCYRCMGSLCGRWFNDLKFLKKRVYFPKNTGVNVAVVASCGASSCPFVHSQCEFEDSSPSRKRRLRPKAAIRQPHELRLLRECL